MWILSSSTLHSITEYYRTKNWVITLNSYSLHRCKLIFKISVRNEYLKKKPKTTYFTVGTIKCSEHHSPSLPVVTALHFLYIKLNSAQSFHVACPTRYSGLVVLGLTTHTLKVPNPAALLYCIAASMDTVNLKSSPHRKHFWKVFSDIN